MVFIRCKQTNKELKPITHTELNMLSRHMPFSQINELQPPRHWLRRHSHDQDEENRSQVLYDRKYIILYLQIYFEHVHFVKVKKQSLHLYSRALNDYINTKSNLSKRETYGIYTNTRVNRIIMEYVMNVSQSMHTRYI